MQELPKPGDTVALFDFDGTLTYHDIFFQFLIYCSDSPWVFFRLLPLVPQWILFSFSRLSRQEVKEALMTQLIGGIPEQKIKEAALNYVNTVVPKSLRPQAMEKLKWHQSQGHYCVIVSANLSLLLKPWVEQVRIQALIATDLETTESGAVTGKIAGINCWGKEKVRRVELLLGDKTKFKIYAYGDTRGDWDLLQWSDIPHYRPFRH